MKEEVLDYCQLRSEYLEKQRQSRRQKVLRQYPHSNIKKEKIEAPRNNERIKRKQNFWKYLAEEFHKKQC